MRVLRRWLAFLSEIREPLYRCRVGVPLLIGVVLSLLLLGGCDGGDDGGHVHEDDFNVSFPSPLEIAINRSFDEPFEVLEIGVTPFVGPVGSEPYVLVVRGIASFSGVEVVFEAQDAVPVAFVDPLGEPVVDVLITCDCFVDYAILGSPFGDTTIFFD